jgi:hypothetical protein
MPEEEPVTMATLLERRPGGEGEMLLLRRRHMLCNFVLYDALRRESNRCRRM